MPRKANRRKPVSRIPKAKSRAVTRAEYNALVDILNERGVILNGVQRALQIQFQRIAQIQVELDEVRNAWAKTKRSA
jgi:hypothetical protein